MAKKHRAHSEDAWATAKKICRLNARQVEMARRLGMNPKKLPGLRPSPQQRWKLPVGAFIEECYEKRFGTDADSPDPRVPQPSSGVHPFSPAEPHALRAGRNVAWQLSDLICYLINLADDLEKWCADGAIDRDIPTQVGEELRQIAQALETGAPIPQVPGIPLPPQPSRRARRRENDLPPVFDDEIPF